MKNTNPKGYVAPIDTMGAKNEEERQMAKIYNAARISAAKTAGQYDMGISREDIEDAGSDAALVALEKTTHKRGSVTYASRCGYTSAIKASERIGKESKNVVSLDWLCGWNGNAGSEDFEGREFSFTSDEWADAALLEEEELAEEEVKKERIWNSFYKLPENDKIFYRLVMEGKSDKQIAKIMGCTVDAIYKRRIDAKRRFKKFYDEFE